MLSFIISFLKSKKILEIKVRNGLSIIAEYGPRFTSPSLLFITDNKSFYDNILTQATEGTTPGMECSHE